MNSLRHHTTNHHRIGAAIAGIAALGTLLAGCGAGTGASGNSNSSPSSQTISVINV